MTAPRTQPTVAERSLTSYNVLLPVVYPTLNPWHISSRSGVCVCGDLENCYIRVTYLLTYCRVVSG